MEHKYITVEKKVGETPLQALEKLRATEPKLADLPIAYAGRLDPMASGKLLLLIGDECKKQTHYHKLDKEYEFEVVFGLSSDTADVLGIVSECTLPKISTADLKRTVKSLVGNISLPYPHFSSKTVEGKPLHTWTLEGRLDEIEIPTRHSRVFTLDLLNMRQLTKDKLYAESLAKINSLPEVTDERKALGADFRRKDVRASWKDFYDSTSQESFTVANFRCIASSGSYMRSLAEVVAKDLGTCGLAYSIHRTKIGHFRPIIGQLGFWTKQY